MKKITLLTLLMFAFFSCKKEVQKSKKTVNSQALIYSSKAINPFLKYNSEHNDYQIIGLNKPEKFNKEELYFPLQGNDFNYTKSDTFDYFTATTFDLNKINYKVIIYNTYGENDIKVLNVQLNSYLDSGEQIDALLLDCRFTFETIYYNDFSIKKNGIIEIKKIAVENLEYNDEGDIIGNKTINDTVTELVKYKINPTGHFIKTTH
jgi:hypothetical protein